MGDENGRLASQRLLWSPHVSPVYVLQSGGRAGLSLANLGLPFPPFLLPSLKADSPIPPSGIMGYGAIGRQVARLASALGMEVYAYTRSPRPTPESRRHAGYTVPNTGDPDGLIPARWFSGGGAAGGDGAVDDFLAQDLDLLLLSLPLDESTRGLFGREQFRGLAAAHGGGGGGRRTFVSNISRGPVVDTDALVEALEGGLISGAALDVQDPEPLPADHSLWDAPNVFITPHIGWQSVGFHARMVEKLWKNLELLDAGEPRFDVIKKPGQEKEPLKL